MRYNSSPFIKIPIEIFYNWQEGYGELSAIINEAFAIPDTEKLLRLDNIYPLYTYWSKLFEEQFRGFKELVEQYCKVLDSLLKSFFALVEDGNNDSIIEPKSTLFIIYNRLRDTLNNKKDLQPLGLACLHHSVHLLWQYVDLSFEREETGYDVPQKL
ncbi:MAG TPA: hypothetical protein PKW49_03800 [Paludibacteraceae bacterium]|nr:hypothetical protein [Paludibacteraceae bacterium]